MNGVSFRQEAVSHFENKTAAIPRGVSPLSSPIVRWLIFIFVLLIIVAISFVNYSQKSVVSGVLESNKGISRIFPRSTGVIFKIDLEPGDLVEKGQELFTINETYYSGVDEQSLQKRTKS